MTNHPFVIIDSDRKAKTLCAQHEDNIDILLVGTAPLKAAYRVPEDKLKKAKPVFDVSPLASDNPVVEKLLTALDRDIYLALDCDQQGEYWSWLLSEFLAAASKGTKIPRRLHLIGLDRDMLHESFRLVEPVESERAVSFHIRSLFNSYLIRHLKRLLGTSSGPNNLPLNYYSLTALFVLAERESEIQAFTPSMKWQLKVKLATPGGVEFTARLEEAYEISDDGYLKDAAEGKEVMNLLREKTFTVHEIGREELSISPPLPYRLADLLQDAFILYGMEPGKVLESALQLFSGVEISGKLTGLITSFIPMGQSAPHGLIEKLRMQVETLYGENALGSGGNLETGVDFILPVRPETTKESLKDILGKEACDLYGLIWARALASQMKEAVGDTLEVEVRAGDEFIFLASDRVISDKGFLSTYYGYHDRELLKPATLANIEEGQALKNLQIIPEQTLRFPPEFHTFESLFAELADFAIMLEPSTILMMQSMINSNYLSLTQEGYLRCKENVSKVLNTIARALPSIPGINFSAYFAQLVEEAASGRKSLDMALRQFDQTLMMQGNVLAKVSLPASFKPRARKSSSIIKVSDEPATAVTSAEKAFPGVKPFAAGTLEERKESEQLAEQEVSAPRPREPETVGDAAIQTPETVEQAKPAGGIAEVASEEAAEPQAADAQIFAVEPETVPAEEEMIPEAMEGSEAVTIEESEEAKQVFDQPPEEHEVPAASEETFATQEESQEKIPSKQCPDCGRPLLLKSDRFGKYWYCSGHPACRHSESYDKEAGLQMDCPLCGVGKVVIKHTQTGKTFYVCPEQDCEFMAWALPHAIPCQACNLPYLVERKTISGKSYLRCPRAGCNYMQPLQGEEGAGDGEAPRTKKLVRVRRRGKRTGAAGKVRKVRVIRRKK